MSSNHAWDWELTIKGRLTPGSTPRIFRHVIKQAVAAISFATEGVHVETAKLTMHRIVHGSQTITTDLTNPLQGE